MTQIDELEKELKEKLAFRDFGPEADKQRLILKMIKLCRASQAMKTVCRTHIDFDKVDTLDLTRWKMFKWCLDKEVFGDDA